MMKSQRDTKKIKGANLVKKVADYMLYADANSTTCMLMHQPKAPGRLDEFKVRIK